MGGVPAIQGVRGQDGTNTGASGCYAELEHSRGHLGDLSRNYIETIEYYIGLQRYKAFAINLTYF